MEIYADSLYSHIPKINSLNVGIYRPKKSYYNKFIPNICNISTRVSRYIDYPLKTLPYKNDFNHIIDHSYSHLVQLLDPERCIVTVHDLIPILAWNGFIPSMKLNHRPLLFEYSCFFLKKVKKIIAVSQSTKNDLINQLDISEDKIQVIHNGVHNYFRPLLNKEEIKNNNNLFRDEYFNILIIGNSDYKNNKTAFEVVEILEKGYHLKIQLLCLGNDYDAFKLISSQHKLSTKPRFFCDLSSESVVELYNSSDCLFFPSLYEGFGFPPLEAMSCGVPVVSSNVASLPEIVGNAGLLADPCDKDAFVFHIYNVLTNNELKSDLIKKGLEKSSSFSWQKAATSTLELYKNTWDI